MTCMSYRARRPPDKSASPLRPETVKWNHAECGSVTAEFATVLPAVMVVALLLLSLTRLVAVSISCQDAASAAARAAISAGGEMDPAAAAQAVVGNGVTVRVGTAGQQVSVVTRCPVIPDPNGLLPTVVEGRAVGIMT